MTEAYVEDGTQANSGKFDGLANREAMKAIVDDLAARKLGDRTVLYHLRDWLISRQRYWGVPIPMVNCPACGYVPVPEKDLPVVLPTNVDFSPGALSPLLRSREFLDVKCPKCGGPAKRETDTMDTFMDSSWYFLRYASPTEAKAAFDRKALDYWMPVDEYVGGIEHAILHLLYSRFFQKVLYDLKLVRDPEPFSTLFTHGMVLKDGVAMSKSKGNTVTPDDIISRYGCDTVRMYMMFAAPPEKDVEWTDTGIEGIARFLRRVEGMMRQAGAVKLKAHPYRGSDAPKPHEDASREMVRWTHEAIQRVTRSSAEGFHFNTAISALMEFSNAIAEFQGQTAVTPLPRGIEEANMAEVFAIKRLFLLMAPFAPHLAEEWWEWSGEKPSVFDVGWPPFSADAAQEDVVEVPVQVNGKLRGVVRLARGTAEAGIREAVMADQKVVSSLAGRPVRRWIVVPDKLVNLVV